MNAEIVSGGGRRRKAEPAPQRPLSDLIAEGWDVAHYAAAGGTSGLVEHSFHLRRGSENKLLVVRHKLMGEGLHAEAFDL